LTKNIFLLIISIIISVLIIDLLARHPYIALRFFPGPAIYYYDRFPKIHTTLRHVGNIEIETNVAAQLSWMLGDATKDRKILFVTDELGFRNLRDYKTDYFDTILLGDSFGFCAISDQKKLLSERLNDAGYAVYNLSAEGIGLWVEFVALRYEISFNLKMKGKQRIIWLLFEGNDLEGRFYKESDPKKLINNKTKEISVTIENYYKRSVLRAIFKSLFRDKRQKSKVLKRPFFNEEMLFYEPYVNDVLDLTLEDIYGHENYEAIKSLVESMRDFANEHDFEVLCVVVPMKARVYEWVLNGKSPWSSDLSQSAFSKFIQGLCAHNKIAFTDLTPEFIIQSKELYGDRQKAIYWLDDTHWNDEGQEIAACIIDKLLRGRSLNQTH
jgi:hypothetical protein